MSKVKVLMTLLSCHIGMFAPYCARANEEIQAQEILAPYKKGLKNALMAEIKEGVTNAIEVCQMEAPKIKASISEGDVLVGRTSHRLRNPENMTPAWVEPVLQSYLSQEGGEGGLNAQKIELSEGRVGYVEPILLQPVCTTCHGETISKEVKAKIAALYPNDKAVGFKVGDFRGVFWAEYDEGK